MWQEVITPRFSDTDALGHINNTVFAVWFEGARRDVFKIFTPELKYIMRCILVEISTLNLRKK